VVLGEKLLLTAAICAADFLKGRRRSNFFQRVLSMRIRMSIAPSAVAETMLGTQLYAANDSLRRHRELLRDVLKMWQMHREPLKMTTLSVPMRVLFRVEEGSQRLGSSGGSRG
jgi:hypothetical protein